LSAPHRANYPPCNRFRGTRTYQNTIGSQVEINYPFHPLFGKKLKVVRESITKNGTIFIDAPKGFCKEIPSWMTQPECTDYHISELPHISLKAILRAIELLEHSIDDLLL
jgi:hypothetical protein